VYKKIVDSVPFNRGLVWVWGWRQRHKGHTYNSIYLRTTCFIVGVCVFDIVEVVIDFAIDDVLCVSFVFVCC